MNEEFDIIVVGAGFGGPVAAKLCAACWYFCKEEAIDFSWPKGGTGYRSDWG